MTEPLPQRPAEAPSDDAPPSAQPDVGAAVLPGEGPLAAAEPDLVPGERLGPPLGASRVIAEFGRPRPSYVFLALGSVLTLASDLSTKAWADRHLGGYADRRVIIKNYLELVLAKNRGGAWGLLQSTSENVRRPFFLLVSVAAIAFIVTLYRRLHPRQRALKWGLPLVLGGALGNVLDRIRDGQVVDFIDAYFIRAGVEHHWPTFNVADIAICVGVGLMALDMFTSKRGRAASYGPRVPPAQSGEPVPMWRSVIDGPAGDLPQSVAAAAPVLDPPVAAPAPAGHPSPEGAAQEPDTHR